MKKKLSTVEILVRFEKRMLVSGYFSSETPTAEEVAEHMKALATTTTECTPAFGGEFDGKIIVVRPLK